MKNISMHTVGGSDSYRMPLSNRSIPAALMSEVYGSWGRKQVIALVNSINYVANAVLWYYPMVDLLLALAQVQLNLWLTISVYGNIIPFKVFTATVSGIKLLSADIRWALYTTPNSPATIWEYNRVHCVCLCFTLSNAVKQPQTICWY